jgi:hypothetical protein
MQNVIIFGDNTLWGIIANMDDGNKMHIDAIERLWLRYTTSMGVECRSRGDGWHVWDNDDYDYIRQHQLGWSVDQGVTVGMYETMTMTAIP